MNIFEVVLIQPLTNGLILFYKFLGSNLGVAIIAFSLFLRFLLNPLTKPYMESMKKMRKFAPELEKIKSKHKGDRVKQAQAQADFYKSKGISPGSGCLPYLLQIVVLIAFFNVFTRTIYNGENLVESFNNLLYEPLKFASDAVINTKFLYLDVTKPDTFNIEGIGFPIPGPILIAAALIQLFSSKIMSQITSQETSAAKATKSEQDDFQVALQRSMVYTFPLFTIIIGIRFPSALALYWLVFSLTQLQQQLSTVEKKDLVNNIKNNKLVKNFIKSK